ncbi:hypothetical protein RO3G_14266 [Lichtheimia corymbifera JMRC:FSU:9682]|uniref:Zn(2)-C6 fungal-type domain-containing protein n=1 Tax=Lichtheimia corymbifera JMRC:FSU:9682 TaxID=1263082 RepID=A0A068RGQ0_9FUNG|nr:hypothetical protein RO3G_14266 [Lichtheimia corymbifera JMRC:FSU:9682]
MREVVFTESIEHRSRHVPCEHCRKHRRKCATLTGTHCERCRRMALVCLYKFTRRPAATAECPQAAAIEAKRRRLLRSKRQHVRDQVRQLEQLVNEMETELQAYGNHRRRRIGEAEQLLSISAHNDGNMRIEAPVKTVAELLVLMKRARAYFCTGNHDDFYDDDPPIIRSPLYFSDRRAKDAYLMIQRASPIEYVLRRFILGLAFGKSNNAVVTGGVSTKSITNEESIDHNHPSVINLKRRIIHHYFEQTCYPHQRLIRSHYLPRLLKNTDSLLANSIVAAISNSLCNHVSVQGLPFTRKTFATSCQQKAYMQLRDVLFDEPTVEIVASIRHISTCLMLELNVQEARRLVHLGWRMVLVLKNKYWHLLHSRDNSRDMGHNVSLVEAESWRRLFYDMRSFEMSLAMLFNDGTMDLSSLIASAQYVGRPMRLAEEETSYNTASDVYQYLTALSILPGHFDSAFERQDITCCMLYAGMIERISYSDMAYIESRLVEFWHILPRAYVLSDAPVMEVLSMERIRQCQEPYIMYLNLAYFMYWILIQMRLMRVSTSVPDTNDTRDSQRALAIVSTCCDAVAKLSLTLYDVSPCLVDVHWLVLISDLLMTFKNAADDVIRTRAQENLQWMMYILNNLSQKPPTHTSPTSSTPSNFTPTPPPAFHGEMSRLMTVRIKDNGHHNQPVP